MTDETIVIRLVTDATKFLTGLDYATSRLIGYIGGFTTQIARSGIQLATAFEKNVASVQAMVKDMAVGSKLVNDITNLAVETPFSSEQLLEATKQLKSFGFATGDVIDTLKVLGDVSAGTGTDLGRITLAFGQVRVAGKLMGTELRQFVDAGVPLIEYLAQVMGKPAESIRMMTEQGKIGFAEVVQAFNAMTAAGGQFAGQTETRAQTIRGMAQALRELAEVATRNFTDAAFEGLGLKDTMRGLVNSVKDLNQNAAQPGTVAFFRDVKAVLTGFWIVVKQVAGTVADVYRAVRQWVIDNEHLIKYVAITVGLLWGMAAAVKAVTISLAAMRIVLVAVYTLSGLAALVSGLIGLKTILIGMVSGAVSLAAALAPVAAFFGTLFALSQLFGGVSGIFQFSGEAFTKGWAAIKGMKDAWVEFTAALSRGDTQSAIEVFTTSVTYAWKVMIITLKGEWEAFKRGLGTGWAEFKTGAGPAFQKLADDLIMGQTEALMRATGKTDADVAAMKEGFQKLQLERAKKVMAEVKAIQDAAAAEQAEMMKNLLDPARNPSLRAAKEAMDAAVANSRQAGIDQTKAAALKAFMEENSKAVVTVLSAMDQLNKRLAGPDGQAILDNLPARDVGALMRAFAGKIQTTITPAMEKLLPADVTAFAEKYATLMGLPGKVLPALRDLQGFNTSQIAQMVVPMNVSARARDVFNEISKEFEKGVTVWEQETKRLAAVNEAFQGNVRGREMAAAAAGGLMMAANLGIGGKDIANLRAFEDVQRYFRLQKAVGEYKPPPAAYYGTSAAQDIINANTINRVTMEQEILQLMRAAQAEGAEQTRLQKEIAEGTNNLRQKGVILFDMEAK